MLKKIGKVILYIILGFFCLIVLYLLFAIVLTVIPVNRHPEKQSPDYTIYISSNGVHTFLVLPVYSEIIDWTYIVRLEDFNFDSDIKVKYIEFGWGDEEFYINTPTWSDLKFKTAFKAVFLPSSSAINAIYLTFEPKVREKVFKIEISAENYKILTDYILESFKYNQDNEIILVPVKEKTSQYENYYKAEGKYTLFKTCNNWTGKGLKKIGEKTGIWTPFEQCVLYHLK